MKRFVDGEHRTQVTLLPECLDDCVEANKPVRVIDVFVDGLDLGKLGFDGVEPSATGRPSYHPAALRRIYIYGYLNRVQSSRVWSARRSATFVVLCRELDLFAEAIVRSMGASSRW